MENKYNTILVTFINELKKEETWKKWKCYSECTEEELNKINLRQIFPNEIILDIEKKEELENIKTLLDAENYKYFIYETGSRGYHIHLYFNNLEFFDFDVRTEIRKIFIRKYKTDETKASENTLIAIENRPHFKTGKHKKIVYAAPGENTLDDSYIQSAMKNIDLRKTNKKLLADDTFKDYHIKDEFFNYIKNNQIPDGTFRDMVIFPNIAVALVKEGLSEEEINTIMKPIIKDNFKGKHYGEFSSWVKKAFNGIATDYNPIQINSWIKNYTNLNKVIYDLTPTLLENLERSKQLFISDEELENSQETEVEWLVEKWIPAGDICFIIGKAASFKTTATLHMIYAIANGKLVFNNYKTTKSKVLYINEENYKKLYKKMIKRVKLGLDIKNTSDNVYHSVMENLRLEKKEDINNIIDFVNQNDIRVIIFDSFRRFFIGKENDADIMNQIFNVFKYIRKMCNDCTILSLHHAKKDTIDSDIRDVARGSSDIINSTDSAIIIKRKHGQDAILIEHIKNRAGEEMIGKIIKIDPGENHDMAYFYETKLETHNELILSESEKCANDILKFLEDNKIKVFSRKDLLEINKKYKYDTITKGLRELTHDGTLITQGNSPHIKYIFTKEEDSSKQEIL